MLLLRDSAQGPEVLMTRRADRANFAAGAYVFPGGAIDANDHGAHAFAVHRPQQTGYLLTQAIAAIRESFEELGILLAWRPDGTLADARDVAALDRVVPQGGSFVAQCAARGLRLAADQLRHLARWIADPNNPRRFDTAFFVARMPENQIPVADDTEQFEPVWLRPGQALARHASGAFPMIFPTIRTLERLAAHASVASILGACAGEGPLTYNATRSGLRGGEVTRLTAGDEGYGDVALICPDGQSVPVLDWQCLQPVALTKNVMRLTAGVDGAGLANSYLVGDPSSGYIVVDPGPEDAMHLARLRQAAGGDIRMIVGSPAQAAGARALHALCGGTLLLAGVPGHPLADGQRLVLDGSHARHTLAAMAVTGLPGSGPCLLLEEDGLMFTRGLPADVMTQDWLQDAAQAWGVEFVLPGRGHVRHCMP